MKTGDIFLLTIQILGTIVIIFIAGMFMMQQKVPEDLGDGAWERVSNPLFITPIFNILLGAMMMIHFLTNFPFLGAGEKHKEGAVSRNKSK